MTVSQLSLWWRRLSGWSATGFRRTCKVRVSVLAVSITSNPLIDIGPVVQTHAVRLRAYWADSVTFLAIIWYKFDCPVFEK